MTVPAGEHALKKGTAELLVLAQLEDEPRHGYDIAVRIDQRSNGAVVFNVALFSTQSSTAWKRKAASRAGGSNALASAGAGSTG